MTPVVLVTGATRGIGLAIARRLAPGWRVLVGGTDADRVAEVVAELPGASGFVADLADEEATAAAAAGVDRLDALVHSAGVLGWGTVADTSRAEWRRVLEVNVVAVSDLTRLLLPLLRASGGGQVVAINSGSGFTSGPAVSAYSASKFALRAWTDALREEERGRVRVVSIHPGRTDTDMQHELHDAEGRAWGDTPLLAAESVAAAVEFALSATPDASVDSISIRPARRS